MPEGWQSRSERPTPVVPLLHIRFREQLERLKQEPAWRSGDRNAITLTKEPHLRVVLIAMKKGARLHEHRASGPITIQATSGSLRLAIGDQVLELKPGEVAVLESAIEHEVEALEESALLLTLVKPT
jgi:quercetin dioxygenase-like cupin family protein